MSDAISNEIEAVIDNAMDQLFEQLDRVRDKHGLEDSEMVERVNHIGGSDLTDAYLDWIHDGLVEDVATGGEGK